MAGFEKVCEVFEVVPSSVVSLHHPDLSASQKLVVVTVFVVALLLQDTSVETVHEVGQGLNSDPDVVVFVDVAAVVVVAGAFGLDVVGVADTFAFAHVVAKRFGYTAHIVEHSRIACS